MVNAGQVLQKMIDGIRRKSLALITEQGDCVWLRRYCDDIKTLPFHWLVDKIWNGFLPSLFTTMAPPTPKIKT
jgi:hypothetical protein